MAPEQKIGTDDINTKTLENKHTVSNRDISKDYSIDALRKKRKGHETLKELCSLYVNNPDNAMQYIRANKPTDALCLYKELTEEIRKDINVAKELIKKDNYHYEHIHRELKQNTDLAKEQICHDLEMYKMINCKSDFGIIDFAYEKYKDSFLDKFYYYTEEYIKSNNENSNKKGMSEYLIEKKLENIQVSFVEILIKSKAFNSISQIDLPKDFENLVFKVPQDDKSEENQKKLHCPRPITLISLLIKNKKLEIEKLPEPYKNALLGKILTDSNSLSNEEKTTVENWKIPENENLKNLCGYRFEKKSWRTSSWHWYSVKLL